MTLVAGVDSSTQSCKVVIRDASTGVLVRHGSAKHPDGTEIDPAHWERAFNEAVTFVEPPRRQERLGVRAEDRVRHHGRTVGRNHRGAAIVVGARHHRGDQAVLRRNAAQVAGQGGGVGVGCDIEVPLDAVPAMNKTQPAAPRSTLLEATPSEQQLPMSIGEQPHRRKREV